MTESRFNLIVQRGRQLPSIIGSDATGTPGGNLYRRSRGVVTLDDRLVGRLACLGGARRLLEAEGAILSLAIIKQMMSMLKFEPFLQYNGRFETAGTANRSPSNHRLYSIGSKSDPTTVNLIVAKRCTPIPISSIRLLRVIEPITLT